MGWQRAVAARLARAGHAVVVAETAGAPWPASVDLLLRLEGLLYGQPGIPAPIPPSPADAGAAFDLLIDLSGRAGAAPPGALRLLYDELADPRAAVAALLDHRAPHLAIVREGAILEAGLPAIERPQVLSAGLAAVFARAADLCVRAVARLAAGETGPARGVSARPASSGLPAVARFGAAVVAAKAQGALRRLLRQGPRWRSGLRPLDGPGLMAGGALGASYRWLPDDGQRFYADPFLLEHEGRTWLFVEEFPYATGIGVISVAEVGADGRASTPRPVLETGSHLSYPFVFVQDGAVWMIPESSAAGTVELFRATDFPWAWQRERVLLDNVSAADTTPVLHDGRLWLFANTTEPGGSSWDALSLFHGDLMGTFAAHPLNPVLIDAGAARPAGRMRVQDGVILRPAQDCRAGYGAGLAICAVDRLDMGGYSQSILRTIVPPPAWRAQGLHTVNEGGGFEAVDIFSARPPAQ